ncbi:hypothetical protein [Phytohabitans rumicis]|uniref:Uncharacterized protein n=1 Tax=Phytohabitans rumicis TaxID=1076125 RepID=A0A6V8LH58_9ACTN|nr:hypothetical protein [Phytohabitans rumicis]GFJ93436.1 hypothetical protein Prum_070780 [Phytohabitans rumicis]
MPASRMVPAGMLPIACGSTYRYGLVQLLPQRRAEVSATAAIFVHDCPLLMLLKMGSVCPAAGWLLSSKLARIRPVLVCVDLA